MKEGITVWRFSDAPKQYQSLSTNGGDEDWLALVPAEYKEEYIGWLESDAFGCCCRDEFDLGDGRKVVIGSHS